MKQNKKSPNNEIIRVIDLLTDVFLNGGKLFVAGNGGSMADALHISGELLKSFRIKRRTEHISTQPPGRDSASAVTDSPISLEPAVPVWVLGANPSLSSAVRNDFPEPNMELAQELFAAGRNGDALIGISTSGNAANIINAFRTAKIIGIKTIALTGIPGEPLSSLADNAICAEGKDTADIQEHHIVIYHKICTGIEEKLFGTNGFLAGSFSQTFKDYPRFDFSKAKTYPLLKRQNRSSIKNMKNPGKVKPSRSENSEIQLLAEKTVKAHKNGLPVIVMMGAHLIKNGLGPLLNDLMKRKVISITGVNGACPIHDTEIAYCGRTSETVSEALPRGKFGFAWETGEILNTAYKEALIRDIGAGTALGAVIAGDIKAGRHIDFPYRHLSVFYNAYKEHIPITIHATMGTDITDQHPNVSFMAKGYASGIDFAIFAEMITHLNRGGVIIDIGGAVTQPEVLLKSVSMAANISLPPKNITTAVFDLFRFNREDMDNEEKPDYYRRNIKSIVVRIPAAFNGKGIYIEGNQKETFMEFYSAVKYLLNSHK